MIRSRTGLGFLLAFLTVQEGSLRLSPPPQTPQKQRTSGCPTPGGPALPVSPGRPIECRLTSGDEHAFRLFLRAGDLLQGEVIQKGIDATVVVLNPAGDILLKMDSLNGGEGEEPLLAFADRPGEYRLRVQGLGKGWGGSYRLSLQEPRPAGPTDRERVTALQKMTGGDLLAALRIWESIRDKWGQMLTLERLGAWHGDKGEYSKALDAYNQGMTLAREVGDPFTEVRLFNQAGLAHRSLEDRETARDFFERALEVAEQERNFQGQALALNNLGLIFEDRGELRQAQDYYNASLRLWEQRVNDPGEQARTLANLGETYLTLSEPSEALSYFNKALQLLRLAPDLREVQYAVVDGAGTALQHLGLQKRALWHYRMALGLADKPHQKARTLYRLGRVYFTEGDLQKAANTFEESLQFSEGQDPRYEGYVLAELAHIDHQQGRKAEALQKYGQALRRFEDLADQLSTASSLFGRARVLRDLGRLEDAVGSVKRSVDIVESLRAELQAGDRISFFASRYRFYGLYIELLMELRRPKEAFEASENARARTLLDNVAGKGGPATEAMALEEIQSELLDDRDSLLLVYSLGERQSSLWAVSRDEIKPFKLPPREVVEEAALQTWKELSTKGGKPDVGALSRMLLPPALGLTPRTRLLVSLDGALHLIPFAVLPGPDGRRLVFDHQIVYEPSASVLVGMRRKLRSRPLAPKTIAAFVDPVFERDDLRFPGSIPPAPREGQSRSPGIGNLERLPSTRREAETIRKLVPEKDRFEALGFSANRGTVLEPALRQYRMLHFGTHHLSGVNPERTGLVLSLFDRQGRPIEGLLRTTEVYDLDFPVELVVLSACGTGLAEEVRGEGPMGLPRAFFHAGARRVLVSLWDVEDGATAELMTRFYRHLLEDRLTAAEALRAAQASMVDDRNSKWRDPRHWAPFILLGDPG